MKGKIAVEEAFHLPDLGVGHGKGYAAAASASTLDRQLIDIEGRLKEEKMDDQGIDMELLSFTSPGVQGESDPAKAEKLAIKANDYIATQCAKHPTRFAAFAAVSMHDAHVAAKEARRCIEELGFCGVMLNDFQSAGADGNTMIHFDSETFDPFWAEMERLDRPVYMHPRSTTPLIHKQFYADRPHLEFSAWGFASQLSLHILAICCEGVFDRFPRLQMHFGHMGEHIPADLWRVDHKLIRDRYPNMKMAKNKLIRDYFESNLMITTSGHFDSVTLASCIAQLGEDRILFAVDFPYEDSLKEGCVWFDNIPIAFGAKRKIGRENALKAYHLQDRLKPDMTCVELGIGGLHGSNIYPAEAKALRLAS